jgi:hypothetical protein
MGDSTRKILIIGAVSSLAVTAAAVICGRAEGQSGWRPINAISHIARGRKAAQKNLLTARYTGMGLLLNGMPADSGRSTSDLQRMRFSLCNRSEELSSDPTNGGRSSGSSSCVGLGICLVP